MTATFIRNQLLDELSPQVRSKIAKNVPADFTKLNQADLLRRF